MTTSAEEIQEVAEVEEFDLDIEIDTRPGRVVTAPRMDGYTTYGTCATCYCGGGPTYPQCPG